METTSFWTYLAVLRKRLWVILLLFAATMIIILGRDWLTPPGYQSSLVLQALPLEPEEVTLYTRLGTSSQSDVIDLIVYQFSYLVRSTQMAQQTKAETDVDITVDELADSVSVVRDPRGDLLTVSVTAKTPEDAEALLVKQVDLSLAELRQSRARSSETSRRFLDAEMAIAEQGLDVAQEELLNFKLANGLEDVDREIRAEQDAIRELVAAQEEANIEAQRLDAIVEMLEKQAQDAQARAAAEPVDSVEAVYLRDLVRNLSASAASQRVEAVGQRARADSAYALLAKHQTNLASLMTIAGKQQQLVEVVQEKQDTRDFLFTKAREAQLKVSQSRSIGYLQVVGSPSTPRSQVATRTLRTALLGGGLSLVAGVILAYILESLERTLRRTSSQRQERT
jgi:uncharacterized protein involved in exopolysaccharide biosynthesis